jgi:hypothetical protein
MSMGLAGLFLIGAAASFGRVALLKLAGERLVARLRTQTFAALLAKDVAYYDARRSGDMLSRISADTIVLSKAFFECSAAARSAISAVGGAGLLLYISPPLTALSLAVMPVVGVGAVLYGRYVKRLSKSAQTALGDAVGSAGERLASIRTVKLCNGELRCVGIVSSCRVVSCLVLPCLVLSCHVLSCVGGKPKSCLTLLPSLSWGTQVSPCTARLTGHALCCAGSKKHLRSRSTKSTGSAWIWRWHPASTTGWLHSASTAPSSQSFGTEGPWSSRSSSQWATSPRFLSTRSSLAAARPGWRRRMAILCRPQGRPIASSR